MKHPLALALAIALTTSVAACAQSDANPQADTAVTADASNPFFTESQLPLHYPRFTPRQPPAGQGTGLPRTLEFP